MIKELRTIFKKILADNKNTLNTINEIRTAAGWYQQARKQPDKIPSIMINDAVERLLEHAEPYLAAHMIDKIKVKVRPDLDGLEVIEINPPPLKPYVEYLKVINRVPSDGIKVVFNAVFGLKLEDIRFRKVDSRQTEVHIDKLSVYITMSIIEVVVSILKLPTITFRGSISLCNQQLFKVEDVSFNL